LLEAEVISNLFDIRQKLLHEENLTVVLTVYFYTASMEWNQCAPMPTLRRTSSTNCWILDDSVTSGWVQCPHLQRIF